MWNSEYEAPSPLGTHTCGLGAVRVCSSAAARPGFPCRRVRSSSLSGGVRQNVSRFFSPTGRLPSPSVRRRTTTPSARSCLSCFSCASVPRQAWSRIRDWSTRPEETFPLSHVASSLAFYLSLSCSPPFFGRSELSSLGLFVFCSPVNDDSPTPLPAIRRGTSSFWAAVFDGEAVNGSRQVRALFPFCASFLYYS